MLKYFKPQNINSPKKRLGINKDGGYVMPELVLDKCVALFTYGVGGDTSYEVDFENQYQKPVYMFDHTIGHENWDKGNLHFINEGLGNEDKCKDFVDHYNQFNIQGDVFLKIDTEGAEFDYFNNVNIDKLSEKVVGMVLEVHWLEQESNRIKFIDMMEKISKHFIIVHTHGNNWGGEFDYEGFTVPRVPEFSFINKKYVIDYKPDNQDYPVLNIDFPNNPDVADCNLNFLKQL